MVYLLAALALFGHLAVFVAAINRLHAIGMPCWLLRIVNLLWCLLCLGIPLGIAYWYMAWARSDSAPAPLAVWPIGTYLVATWIASAVAGARLILRRSQAPTTSRLVVNHTRHIDIVKELGSRPVKGFSARLASRLPGNEILRLSIHQKTISLSRLPPRLEGLTIAHLSDFHLTGQLTLPFFAEIIRRTNELNADIVAITGDILDTARCLPWVAEIFGGLRSRYGAWFVLGNHDKRVGDDSALRQALTDAGLIDLGGHWRMIDVRGHQVVLAGNELPWFVPAAPMHNCPDAHPAGRPLRIALAHSPDQLDWARTNDCDLMLAGHTHGGQFQLPWIGPVLSPSLYGVRFAAGTFYKQPTLLHVSRGISATRPIRWNCPPELTCLTLARG